MREQGGVKRVSPSKSYSHYTLSRNKKKILYNIVLHYELCHSFIGHNKKNSKKY